MAASRSATLLNTPRRMRSSVKRRQPHEAARAERTVGPIGVAEAAGKLRRPVVEAILDRRQALLILGLSPSTSLAVSRSRIGGLPMFSAANTHVIARAPAFASSGSRPAWRSAIWNTNEQGEIVFLVGRHLADFEDPNVETPLVQL
jgi:hypothetical protein